MKCKCQSVHDQGKVGNISPVWAKCALDHLPFISTTDLMQFLGMLGFYLHLSHISAINPEEATSSAPHVGEAFQLQVHAGAVSL